MAHRTIFDATFRCGNMLQVFESDSKTGNIVVADNVALKIVACNIPLPTVADRCLNKVALKVVSCNMD